MAYDEIDANAYAIKKREKQIPNNKIIPLPILISIDECDNLISKLNKEREKANKVIDDLKQHILKRRRELQKEMKS